METLDTLHFTLNHSHELLLFKNFTPHSKATQEKTSRSDPREKGVVAASASFLSLVPGPTALLKISEEERRRA